MRKEKSNEGKKQDYWEKRYRLGRLLTLLLLLYGMAVTVLFLFRDLADTAPWLCPFAVVYQPLSYWINPAYLFFPLAVISLAGWMVLRLGRLWGRECIIAGMVVYLALNIFFTPFYVLLMSTSWQLEYVGRVLRLGLCGVIYPVLVLISLHRWNPRRI